LTFIIGLGLVSAIRHRTICIFDRVVWRTYFSLWNVL